MEPVKSGMMGRLAILRAIDPKNFKALDSAKKGNPKDIAFEWEDAISMVYALFGPRDKVVDHAYFNDAGEKQHSPKRWLIGAMAWADEIGDDQFKRHIEEMSSGDTGG